MKYIRVAHGEGLLSVVFRLVRSWLRSNNRPEWANHFCPGSSGSGEWCRRSEIKSRCGYCMEPNMALKQELEAQ